MKFKIFLLALACAVFIQGKDVYSRTWVVNQKHERASDEKDAGTFKKPFRTIFAGAEVAGPGDTILVFSGIYRERVAPDPDTGASTALGSMSIQARHARNRV